MISIDIQTTKHELANGGAYGADHPEGFPIQHADRTAMTTLHLEQVLSRMVNSKADPLTLVTLKHEPLRLENQLTPQSSHLILQAIEHHLKDTYLYHVFSFLKELELDANQIAYINELMQGMREGHIDKTNYYHCFNNVRILFSYNGFAFGIDSLTSLMLQIRKDHSDIKYSSSDEYAHALKNIALISISRFASILFTSRPEVRNISRQLYAGYNATLELNNIFTPVRGENGETLFYTIETKSTGTGCPLAHARLDGVAGYKIIKDLYTQLLEKYYYPALVLEYQRNESMPKLLKGLRRIILQT